MIKKITALILVALMTFSLAACGGNKDNVSSTASDSQVIADVESAAQKEDGKDASKQETTASKDNTSKEANKSETANTSSKTNTASKITGVVSGGSTGGNKVTVKDDGTSIKAISDLKVNEKGSVLENLNLKGKTITMAITEEPQYSTAAFKRSVKAFELEYNCKVTLKKLGFGTYNQQVAQAKAAGDIYDICFLHGSYFPALAIDDIYEPLNNYLYKDDVATTSTSGGIDLNKTSYYAYKNKVYGTCDFNAAYPYLIYYNKKMLADRGWTGARDPRKMAERGKWSWSVIEKMGKELTDKDKGKYLLSPSFTFGRAIPLAFGAQNIIFDKKTGKYKQNITSKEYMNSLKYKQKLLQGANGIVKTDGTISFEDLTAGDVYMWCEEAAKYIELVPAVKKSSAFGKKKENIGIVEMPLGDTNKDRYPTGWLTAVACGKGKDPRVAIAWNIFRSKYQDPMANQDATAFSKADEKYINDLLVGNIALDIGRFYSSDEDTGVLITTQMDYSIRQGADVAATVASYKDKVQACINFACKYK